MISRLLTLAMLAGVGVCFLQDYTFLQFNNASCYMITGYEVDGNTPYPCVDVDMFARTTGHKGVIMADGSVLEMGIYKNNSIVLGSNTFAGPSKMSSSTWGSYAVLRRTTKNWPIFWSTAAYSVSSVLSDSHVTFTTAAADVSSPNTLYIAGTACMGATTYTTFTNSNFNFAGRVVWVRGLFVAKYLNTSKTPQWVLAYNVSTILSGSTVTTKYDCFNAFHKAIAPAGLNTLYLAGTTVGDFNVVGGITGFIGICSQGKSASGFIMAIDTSSTTGTLRYIKRICMQPMYNTLVSDDRAASYYFGLAYSTKTSTLFVVGGYRGILGTTMSSTANSATLLDTFWTPPYFAFNPFIIQFDTVNVAWKTDTFLTGTVQNTDEHSYFTDIWIDDEAGKDLPTVYVAGIFASTTTLPGYGVVKGVISSPVAFVGKLRTNSLLNFNASEMAFSYLEHDYRSGDALASSAGHWGTWYMYRWYMTDIAVDSSFVYQTLASPWSNTPFNSSAPLNTRLLNYRKTNLILLMIYKNNFTFYLSGQHNGVGKFFPLGLAVKDGQAYMMCNVLDWLYGIAPWGTALVQHVVVTCYHGVLTEDHVCHCENGWNGTDCNTRITCSGSGTFVWKENKCHCNSMFYGTSCENSFN